MRTFFAILVIGIVAVVIFFSTRTNKTEREFLPVPTSETPTAMKIESDAFQHTTQIPSKYTCDGPPPAGGVNPPLMISDVPGAAKSMVLIVDDPDAPMGTWVHWTLWNIDPATHEIKENSVPGGAVEGMTSFGKPGYGGPCPPSGTHRYFFKLYALSTVLSLSPSATKEDLEQSIEGYILAQAEVIGLYQRK